MRVAMGDLVSTNRAWSYKSHGKCDRYTRVRPSAHFPPVLSYFAWPRDMDPMM